MIVIREIDQIPKSRNPVVTIGTFDGIHLGHQEIIRQFLAEKESVNGTGFLITFEPHPQQVLQSRAEPIRILTTAEEKIEVLADFGIDCLLVLPFTRELSRMTGEAFIRRILLDRIGMISVVIGYDHAFGYKRSGNIDTLQKLGEEHRFAVKVVPPFQLDGTIIKSSLIRKMLINGDVAFARRALGRPYRLSGKVVPGRGRGRKLSFPTANLEPEHPQKLVPGNGIYAIYADVNGGRRAGVVSIGVRPTFNEHERTIEAYLFDFDGDLYGKKVSIEFIEKIRDEEKFSEVDHLVAQMHRDVQIAKNILVEP